MQKPTKDPQSEAKGTGCTLGCVVAIFAFLVIGTTVGTGVSDDVPSWVWCVSIFIGILAGVLIYYYIGGSHKTLEEIEDMDDDEFIVCEVYATYYGGHKAASEQADIKLILTNKRVISQALGYPIFAGNIPLDSIIDFGVDTKERLTASRVLLVGILAFAMKKEEKYLWIKYTDHNGFEQNPVFGSDFRNEFSQFQSELYRLLAERR